MVDQTAGAPRRIPSVGIGVLGYSFMGKAHSHAFISMPHIYWPPPAIPKLICIAGRSEAAVAEASRRYGFERYTTDWRDLIEDPRRCIPAPVVHKKNLVRFPDLGKRSRQLAVKRLDIGFFIKYRNDY